MMERAELPEQMKRTLNMTKFFQKFIVDAKTDNGAKYYLHEAEDTTAQECATMRTSDNKFGLLIKN
ncbi:MAG TPA: hypothetical protein VL574_15265 [Stellaceae bacterium]|nr:hypothetical protein [Stellaceae bacterium]